MCTFFAIAYASLLIHLNRTLAHTNIPHLYEISWKYDVNITRIESRPVSTNNNRFDFFVDFYGSLSDTNVSSLLQELKGMTDKLLVLDEKEVSYTWIADSL